MIEHLPAWPKVEQYLKKPQFLNEFFYFSTLLITDKKSIQNKKRMTMAIKTELAREDSPYKTNKYLKGKNHTISTLPRLNHTIPTFCGLLLGFTKGSKLGSCFLCNSGSLCFLTLLVFLIPPSHIFGYGSLSQQDALLSTLVLTMD